MLEVNEFFHIGSLNLNVKTVNEQYFTEAKTCLSVIAKPLSDFNESDFEEFIPFLQDSVDNNYYLNDLLKEIELKAEENEIVFILDGREERYINMGEIHFLNYVVYISGGYMFISDKNSQKNYMYYGD